MPVYLNLQRKPVSNMKQFNKHTYEEKEKFVFENFKTKTKEEYSSAETKWFCECGLHFFIWKFNPKNCKPRMTASQLNKLKKYWNEHYREEKKTHWGEREKGKGSGGITQE